VVGLPAIAKEKNGKIASVGRTELPEEQEQNSASQLGRLLAWVLPRGGHYGAQKLMRRRLLKRNLDLARQNRGNCRGGPITTQLEQFHNT
jgi:hypothetical protein